MPERIDADLCIIGAGAAGLSVAAGASQLGKRVVLIEKGAMGGDCLNFGCVPSKALIAAAANANEIRRAGVFGIHAAPPVVDFPAVMRHVKSVIAAIAPHDSQERFEGLGVRVIRERAAFISRNAVRAGAFEIGAKRFVIATGSLPTIPDIQGLAASTYLTNETIFDLEAAPSKLIILGGGAVGVELAQAFQRLGVPTVLLEADTILAREDLEGVDCIRRRLREDGVELREGARVAAIRQEARGINASLADGTKIEGSHLLIAAGRTPNLAGLDLDKAGVAIEGGRLVLDARLRTTNKKIFALGDAAGAGFTHIAGDHASTLIRNLLFKAPAGRRDALAPRAVYCDPEIASIGARQSELGAQGVKYTPVRWALSQNDRALAEADSDGFIKAFIGRGGRILGAVIVGRNAAELIGPWALALANGLKIGSFSSMIAPYPTRTEISKRAAGAYYTPTLFSDRTRAIVRLLSTFD